MASELKTNGVETSAIAPSITEINPFDSPTYVMAYVADDGTGDILVTTSKNSGVTWSTPVNTGQKTKATPAIAQSFNDGCGELVIAYVADNSGNHLLTTVSVTGGATWKKDTIVGGSSSPQSSKFAPAITAWDASGTDPGELMMAYVANNSSNQLLVTQGSPVVTGANCASIDAESWSSPSKVGTQSSKTAPAISTFDLESNPIIAYVANDSSNDLVVTTSIDNEGGDWSYALVGSPAQSSKFAPTLTEWEVSNNGSIFDQETMAYVANNSSNDLIVTTSTDEKGTDWSPDALVGSPPGSSQAAPALPNLGNVNPLPMVCLANNSEDHLLLMTSQNGGDTWSGSSKVEDGPRAE
jgi:hypothetical protein